MKAVFYFCQVSWGYLSFLLLTLNDHESFFLLEVLNNGDDLIFRGKNSLLRRVFNDLPFDNHVFTIFK